MTDRLTVMRTITVKLTTTLCLNVKQEYSQTVFNIWWIIFICFLINKFQWSVGQAPAPSAAAVSSFWRGEKEMSGY